MKNNQRLELTWIGKGEKINPEPRILIHDESKSYGDKNTDNLLIHGDNLLALKALEQDYAGKVKCIYIDPPYNTGSAFEHYDDGREHSIWLNLMKVRLEILKNLLSNEGVIFVQIDNREMHYLKILLDEIFGRANYRNSIIVKKGVKNVSVQFDTVERLNAGYDTILMYSKNQGLRIPNLFIKSEKNDIKGNWNNHWRGTDRPTMRYELFGITPEKGQWRWAKERTYIAVNNYIELVKYFSKHKISIDNQNEFDLGYAEFLEKHNIKDKNNFQLVRLSKSNKPEHYIPPSDKILLSENWLDLSVAGRLTNFEHEKNELILNRILNWVTNENDIVLDSFLGSGTTAAVALKMNRKFIGIELGEHCYTHCIPRLKAVIDGEQGGISKTVNWQGGGGFKFYELAPTLLERSKYGNLTISNKYNEEMLAQAMAKHEGYTYAPDENILWKQGFSGDKNYVFTTSGYVSAEFLDNVATELGQDEYLLICSESFDIACVNRHKNIIIRHIPQILLGRCEWGKDSYDLNIILQDLIDDEG